METQVGLQVIISKMTTALLTWVCCSYSTSNVCIHRCDLFLHHVRLLNMPTSMWLCASRIVANIHMPTLCWSMLISDFLPLPSPSLSLSLFPSLCHLYFDYGCIILAEVLLITTVLKKMQDFIGFCIFFLSSRCRKISSRKKKEFRTVFQL